MVGGYLNARTEIMHPEKLLKIQEEKFLRQLDTDTFVIANGKTIYAKASTTVC